VAKDVADNAASPAALTERPVTQGAAGAGDPATTPHDSSNTPPAPLPETPRNPDAISVKVPDKPTALEPAVTAPDAIADAATQLKRIRSDVSECRSNLIALGPTLRGGSFWEALKGQMKRLRGIEEEIEALQKSLHDDRSKSKLPHQFALTVWPGRCKDGCCEAQALLEPWDAVLSEFEGIRERISDVEARLLADVREDARQKKLRERAAEGQERKVRELLSEALKFDGPKRLLDEDHLKHERAALQKRKPTEAKP
jgi:hypothetical protein